MKNSQLVKNVVIVGGGAAGWLTAGRIAAEHNSKDPSGIQITLVESKNIKAIGVGEGTWPTMRTTLEKIGVSETEFIRKCDVSFKQGSKFVNWKSGDKSDFYYHPFQPPVGQGLDELVQTWQKLLSKNKSFAHTMSFQPGICDFGKAPKLNSTAEYACVANYGYHLDATKLGSFLKEHCVNKLGVKHILDDVTQVNPDENGDILSITTKVNGDICGDLFIDCTGLRSLLIGEHYKIPLTNKKDILFNDSALAVHVPYMRENTPIASQTISTALTAGWAWDIGLPSRRGVGYTYSSKYISDEQAEIELKDYVASTSSAAVAESMNPRKISFSPGFRKMFWHKNCVAVGMSAGFLEPLEATALVLIETAARSITEQLPANRQAMKHVASRYNKLMHYHWHGIVDFLKLHYVLSKREQDYWRDNRDPTTIPESLRKLLDFWQYHSPSIHDFLSIDEFFSFVSYQYILYGMDFETELSQTSRTSSEESKIKQCFTETMNSTNKLLKGLPSNRELINQINLHGMQALK